MVFNRYNYVNSVFPKPYDLFMLSSKLTLDLHKNIQGGINGIIALEQYHNRDNNTIDARIFSYEVAASLSLLF